MLNQAEKNEIINDLKQQFQKAEAAFVTNLIGVTAGDSVKIRKLVRNNDGLIVVTRNTLFRKATQGTPYEALFAKAKGPTAVAFAFKDPAAVAKVILDASKENELVKLGSGVLTGQLLAPKDVEILAKLPSRDQMLATLLATFNAPVSAFVRVLDSIKTKRETETAA